MPEDTAQQATSVRSPLDMITELEPGLGPEACTVWDVRYADFGVQRRTCLTSSRAHSWRHQKFSELRVT